MISAKTNSFYRELSQTVQTAEMLNFPDLLIQSIQKLNENLEKEIFVIDLIFSGKLNESVSQNLSKWLLGETISSLNNFLTGKEKTDFIEFSKDDLKIRINFFSTDSVPPLKTDRLNAFISLFIIDEVFNDKYLFEITLQKFIEEIPLLYFINVCNCTLTQDNEFRKILNAKSWKTIFINSVQELTLSGMIELFLKYKANNLLRFLSDYSYSKSFEVISAFFRMYLDQELSDIKGRTAQIKHQLNDLQQNINDRNIQSELLSNLKNQVQYYFTDFDKGIKSHLDNETRNKTGNMWKIMDDFANTLEVLDSEKKAKKTEFFIPGEFETYYLKTIYTNIYEHCSRDLASMLSMYDVLLNKTNEELKKQKIVFVPYYFQHITDVFIKKMLDSTIRIDRPYKSEARSMGGYEYFMAIRRYQMIFFMLFSTFGLSFIRNMYEIMIPITIVLLAFGGYFVFRSVKREKEETEIHELEKAKETLKAETKRIFTEVQREWLGIITEHQREQMQSYLQYIEKQVKDDVVRKSGETAEKKLLINKQISNLEVKEKKKISYITSIENYLKNLQQYKLELKEQIIKLI